MFKEMFCRIIPNMIDSVFVLVTAIVLLALINPYLLIVPLVMIPFFLISLIRFKKLARVNFKNIRGCNSDMNLMVQENIEAVRLVRSFTNEKMEEKKFDETNDRLKHSYIKQVKLSATFEAVFNSIRQFAYIGSIAVSAVLVMNGYMKVGYLVACGDYVLKIMNYINMINNMMFQMQQQIVSGYKMMNFMREDTKIPDGNLEIMSDQKPHIEIRQASMKLDEQKVLANISLDIPYGKKIGIVGGTGSGKSVLLESFIRIHDMTEGEILLNGRNVKEYTLDSLRRQFAYVFQDVFLFSNTIDSNISYSNPECDEEAVERAAVHAQADGFIRKLEEGYKTIVGERGLGISGGQKQRVSIARALLRNAPIIVLDDSTSALDVETEKRLLSEINRSYADRTLIISAHRMSSVVDCDEIIYLLDGSIAERGTFDELMALQGHFANVYQIQEAQKNSVVDFDHLAGEEA
jgi:ATP-binding cassette subfamily B protein